MCARPPCLFVMIVLLAAAPAGAANRPLLSQLAGPAPWLEVQFVRPDFESDSFNPSLLSGHWRLGAAVPVGKLALLLELPVAAFSWDQVGTPDSYFFVPGGSATLVGNLFLGLQTGIPDEGRTWIGGRFGAHFPTAESGAGDPYVFERLLFRSLDLLSLHRYVQDFLTFDSSLLVRAPAGPGVTFGLEVGPRLLVPTGEGGEAELFLRHGAYLEIGGSRLAFFGELAGSVWLTTGDEVAIDHQAAIGAGMDLGLFEPSVFLALPLTEPLNIRLSRAIGVQVRMHLR